MIGYRVPQGCLSIVCKQGLEYLCARHPSPYALGKLRALVPLGRSPSSLITIHALQLPKDTPCFCPWPSLLLVTSRHAPRQAVCNETAASDICYP